MYAAKHPKVLTFASRIAAIWNHVAKSRADFESIPDKGLIGKAVQRVFNKFWNYIIKGAIGTVGLVLIFPLFSFIVSSLSILAALTAPIW